MSSVQQKLVGNEVDKDKDDLPSIDEAELLECEGSENLYLIEKMLGNVEINLKGKEQGPPKEEDITSDRNTSDSIKAPKGPKPS